MHQFELLDVLSAKRASFLQESIVLLGKHTHAGQVVAAANKYTCQYIGNAQERDHHSLPVNTRL
jgi:hypothetical protein